MGALILAFWLTWTDDRGVTHYTDDAARVPSRYVDQVERYDPRPLEEYPRYTPANQREHGQAAPIEVHVR